MADTRAEVVAIPPPGHLRAVQVAAREAADAIRADTAEMLSAQRLTSVLTAIASNDVDRAEEILDLLPTDLVERLGAAGNLLWKLADRSVAVRQAP